MVGRRLVTMCLYFFEKLVNYRACTPIFVHKINEDFCVIRIVTLQGSGRQQRTEHYSRPRPSGNTRLVFNARKLEGRCIDTVSVSQSEGGLCRKFRHRLMCWK